MSFPTRFVSVPPTASRYSWTYVATGEITTLEHEVGDDTVELGARVAEALLTGAEGTEVLDGLWDYIVEELEVDAARAL